MAAANRQQRLVLAKHFIDQNQLAKIAFAAVWGGFDGFAEIAGDAVLVKTRFDVIAAGDQDAIATADAFGDEFAGLAAGHGERKTAGIRDGIRISLGQT